MEGIGGTAQEMPQTRTRKTSQAKSLAVVVVLLLLVSFLSSWHLDYLPYSYGTVTRYVVANNISDATTLVCGLLNI